MSDIKQEQISSKIFSSIESTLGQSIKTSTDFDNLSRDIKHRTGKSIGVSTLKRIWGYVNDEHAPRVSTLNLLAEYVGYKDWDSFNESISTPAVNESGFRNLRSLDVESLPFGSILRLTWQPNRKCVVMYRQDKSFVVLKSELTRLVQDTTFTCKHIYAGESLILENVMIGGTGTSGIYHIGKTNGVQYDIITE